MAVRREVEQHTDLEERVDGPENTAHEDDGRYWGENRPMVKFLWFGFIGGLPVLIVLGDDGGSVFRFTFSPVLSWDVLSSLKVGKIHQKLAFFSLFENVVGFFTK